MRRPVRHVLDAAVRPTGAAARGVCVCARACSAGSALLSRAAFRGMHNLDCVQCVRQAAHPKTAQGAGSELALSSLACVACCPAPHTPRAVGLWARDAQRLHQREPDLWVHLRLLLDGRELRLPAELPLLAPRFLLRARCAHTPVHTCTVCLPAAGMACGRGVRVAWP